ncbi:MAG: hypothetical protein ABI743_05065 [bacterium]
MQLMDTALAAAEQDYFAAQSPEAFRPRLMALIDHDRPLIAAIPPTLRSRFKGSLVQLAMRLFASGFRARYEREPVSMLETRLEMELGQLRRALQLAMRDWDRGKDFGQSGVTMRGQYPIEPLYCRIQELFLEIWQAGLQGGYRARLHHQAQGLARQVDRAVAFTASNAVDRYKAPNAHYVELR